MYPPILTRGKRVAVAEVGRALQREERTREEESQMNSEDKPREKQEAKGRETDKPTRDASHAVKHK